MGTTQYGTLIRNKEEYLVMPKSDTFTSLLFETRQFLAACRRNRTCKLSTVVMQRCVMRKSSYLLSYQISVDEVGALQISHSLRDVQAHAQHRVLGQAPSSGSQVVRQTAALHELKHQTHG